MGTVGTWLGYEPWMVSGALRSTRIQREHESTPPVTTQCGRSEGCPPAVTFGQER